MNKGIKIFVGVVVFLGILSGVFLLVAKNKNQAATVSQTQIQKKAIPAPKNSTVVPDLNKPTSLPETSASKAKEPEKSVQDRKALVRAQWTQCKAKSLPANTSLFWNIQISEGIPTGGTYAKGSLDGDNSLPVNVIIKPDSKMVEKIKSMLVVGKKAILRGTCTDVAADGSVVLQAF
ncbi:MAG: hypothetical protein UR99_C0013G0002 [Candidatus Moranbacteria bacterium GW2011_GWD2_36_12]|nr:MAG: hypothetical protein UR99_C0013G0002 [Candidatus Moranbacteria bacterium GW2011_GWD2_36_12]KKQ06497.1 MAG: hypothetical protein US16_C0016G0015 [Candidatus Moranbacteria bacterium GW2011_GWE2_36_40]